MNRNEPQAPSLHYGWAVVLSSTLGIFACLGLGRFALGMLLPSMSDALSLSKSQMGMISTMNFVGYLAAVLVIGKVTRRLTPRQLIPMSLALIGLSMILLGLAKSYLIILILYFLTGIGSGFANVSLMSLIIVWFSKKLRGRASGFVVIGSGFAILLSGRLVPYIDTLAGQDGWRYNWAILGFLVLTVAIVNLIIIRNTPGEKGLHACGEEAEDSDLEMKAQPRPSTTSLPTNGSIIAHLGLLYFLFGFTYVIYATFLVTTLVDELHFAQSQAGAYWSIIGVLSLASGPVFGTLSDKLGRKYGLMLVFAFQTIAYTTIALKQPGPMLYLSIFCFGIVAWSIPSIMAATIGDYFGAAKAPAIFGFVTFIFGIGQIIGPALAGYLADRYQTFAIPFTLSAILTAVAVLASALLKKSS